MDIDGILFGVEKMYNNKEYYQLNKERIKEQNREYYFKNKERMREQNEIWKKENPQKMRDYKKKWKKNNKEKIKEYYKKNVAIIIAKVNEWNKNNKGKVNAKTKARKLLVKNRIPKCADLEKIEQFYVEAARKTKETGIRYEVDHIVPLQGKTVSGFHVEWNLQILTKEENSSKSNKHE